MFVLPSRGRPASVARFINAYRRTARGEPVVIWIDDDDPELDAYRQLVLPDTVTMKCARPMFVGEIMQAFFELWPDQPMYGFLADDAEPRSHHWDARLVEACGAWEFVAFNEGLELEGGDGPARAAGIDYFRQKRWQNQPDRVINSNFPMVGGELVRAMGGFMPLDLQHFEIDVFWQRVAVTLGVDHYRDDIVLEHLHHTLGKAGYDKTYRQFHQQGSDSGYHGWRRDLSNHLGWWCRQGNLRKLDRIKRSIDGKGWFPVDDDDAMLAEVESNRRARLVQCAPHDGPPDPASKVSLSAHCRLVVEDGQPYLVLGHPARKLQMNHPAFAILERCDGRASVESVATELCAGYAAGQRPVIRRDILAAIDRLYRQGILELEIEPDRRPGPLDYSR